jgi:hypothetical protein
MSCNGDDCKLEWIRFRHFGANPIRVMRRPDPGTIEQFDHHSEEWAVAKALVKRWTENGVAPIHRRIEAHACLGEGCECKPTETPDPADDKRWGPWEDAHVVFVYTDEKGHESVVVEAQISRTTGAGICRPAHESLVLPR